MNLLPMPTTYVINPIGLMALLDMINDLFHDVGDDWNHNIPFVNNHF